MLFIYTYDCLLLITKQIQVSKIGQEWQGLNLSLTGKKYSSNAADFEFPNQNRGASSPKSQIASNSGDNFDDEVSV